MRRLAQSKLSGDGKRQLNLQDAVALVGWPTCRAEDSESTGAHHGTPDTLTSAARLSGWATASSRDYKDTPGMSTTGTNPDGSERHREDQLPRQVHGIISESPTAATGKPAVLAPEFSRWLMGFPAEWDQASPGHADWAIWQKHAQASNEPSETASAG